MPKLLQIETLKIFFLTIQEINFLFVLIFGVVSFEFFFAEKGERSMKYHTVVLPFRIGRRLRLFASFYGCNWVGTNNWGSNFELKDTP